MAAAQLFEPLDVAKASPFIFENNELAGFVPIPLLLLDPAHKQSRAVGRAFVDVDHDQVLRCEEFAITQPPFSQSRQSGLL